MLSTQRLRTQTLRVRAHLPYIIRQPLSPPDPIIFGTNLHLNFFYVLSFRSCTDNVSGVLLSPSHRQRQRLLMVFKDPTLHLCVFGTMVEREGHCVGVAWSPQDGALFSRPASSYPSFLRRRLTHTFGIFKTAKSFKKLTGQASRVAGEMHGAHCRPALAVLLLMC